MIALWQISSIKILRIVNNYVIFILKTQKEFATQRKSIWMN